MKQPRPKVLSIFATRPDAIKMAPICLALREAPDIEAIVCNTGQHREQVDQMLEHFRLKPDYDLGLMKSRQTLSDITSRTIAALDGVLEAVRPDLVLVHGDTAAVFCGSLVGFHHRVRVGHVEAGLRSGEKFDPFPEEMYRRLAGLLADYHFAPTAHNRDSLLREGVVADRIYVTGNSAIDAVKWTVREDYRFKDQALRDIPWETRRVIVVTAHRRENLGERMRQMALAMRDIAEQFEDVHLVYPVHLNPAVREVVYPVLQGVPRVTLTEPAVYPDMVNAMARCHLVLTDSGGLQEDAPYLGKPVLLMRDTTERPEGVAAGTVRLVGADRQTIVREVGELLTDAAAYDRMARAVSPYGDGTAAERTVEAVRHILGLRAERPADFVPENRP